MTIDDEPDEDAANLDDDLLFEAYLDTGMPKKATSPVSDGAVELPEWPPTTASALALPVDAETLNWFRTNHRDWRREMGFVLRAWVAAQSEPSPRATGQ